MIDNNIATQMDFDDWLQLAMNDPDAFETARTAAIQAFLASTPAHSRKRLTGLQWRIDMMRESSRTPMAACQAIYSMMWDKLAGDHGMLDSLKMFTNEGFDNLQPTHNADILPFQPRLEESREPS
ncbi:MAG: DUF3135 domain-containing protein [Sulfuriflexus sp.]|nr:DUF3135 domain-containing protein [Sulfuriflexus sp.]